MRRVQYTIYPALQQPPQTAAAIPPSFGWFQPLAAPKRFPQDPRYNTVQAVSGVQAWSTAQPALDNANVNWFTPFSEPQRFPRHPRYGAVLIGGEMAWPYAQPAVDAANVRWFRPLSEPKRFARDPRYSAALVASGEYAWPYAQPAADNANMRWFQPFSLPVRYARDLRWATVFAQSEVFLALVDGKTTPSPSLGSRRKSLLRFGGSATQFATYWPGKTT